MKKILKAIKRFLSNRYTLLVLRLLLGGILLLAAIGKLPTLAQFVDVVSSYGLLPWSLAKVYGSILPWLELVLGTCLVLGFMTRLVAATSILMIISFIIANGTAVYTSSTFECNCFGLEYYGTGYLEFIKTSDALVIDIVMTLMAVTLLIYGGGRWSLDSLVLPRLKRLMPKKRSQDGS